MRQAASSLQAQLPQRMSHSWHKLTERQAQTSLLHLAVKQT